PVGAGPPRPGATMPAPQPPMSARPGEDPSSLLRRRGSQYGRRSPHRRGSVLEQHQPRRRLGHQNGTVVQPHQMERMLGRESQPPTYRSIFSPADRVMLITLPAFNSSSSRTESTRRSSSTSTSTGTSAKRAISFRAMA